MAGCRKVLVGIRPVDRFLPIFAQVGLENVPLTLYGLCFWHCRLFLVWTSIAVWRALRLTIRVGMVTLVRVTANLENG